jgi:hypothetical protein
MLPPGLTGSGVSTFVIDRSAAVETVVVAVPLSLPVFGSDVADDTVAVFDNTVPAVVDRSTATTNVKTALPIPNDRLVQETVPPKPTAGAKHPQPPGDASETNVVPAGIGSDSLTEAASPGPALLTVMV